MNPFARLLSAEPTTGAARTDAIFLGVCALAVVILLIVLMLVIGFTAVYRRGSKAKRGELPAWVSREVEIGWTVATLFVALFLFWWASSAQFSQWIAPPGALEIHVVGRQWMWKIQHPSGAREINMLHAPLGVPVRLVMTSQDVIHSFYVPAFRMKQDVVPGRYTETWFKASRPGVYDLYCSEYCGLDHSAMTGKVVIMAPADYARWARSQPHGDSLADQGKATFVSLGCGSCHGPAAKVPAPPLEGLFGSQVSLADGRSVSADESYLRSAILDPAKARVAGYPPAMPAYQGVASEEDTVALVAYIRSLAAPPAAEAAR